MVTDLVQSSVPEGCEESGKVIVLRLRQVPPPELSYKSTASLTAGDEIIPLGGSVTLTCSVSSSTGWKFDWFRQKSESSGAQLIRNNEQMESSASQREVYTAAEEEEKENEVALFPVIPTVILQPNWPQIFRGETVTLRCEIHGGGGAQWTYEWRPTSRNSPTSSEYRITAADRGEYRCRGRTDVFTITEWGVLRLDVSDFHPASSLLVTPDKVQHFISQSVTLSCSGNNTEWRLRRFTETGGLSDIHCSNWGTMTGSSCTINTDWSHSGVYWCESGSGDFSNAVNITVQDENNGIILLSPVHPVTEGDPVTLSCRDKEQKLLSNVFFYHNNKLIHNDSREELKISAVLKSDEGFYKCEHLGKESPQSWMAVRDKPQPVLSVSASWLSPGASVTLSCGGLEHPSAGWRFFWYKVVPAKSSSSYSLELLTGRTNWTEQNSYLLNGQNHTAGYVCRAGRGEPVFYTNYSVPKFVWSADSHPAASLSVTPDRVQHFINPSVTLSCSGNNTEWRLRRFTETGGLSDIHCSNWGTMTGSSCSINTDWSHSGVYWCESGSGDFSNAVNITVQDRNNGFNIGPIIGKVVIILIILPLHHISCGAAYGQRMKVESSSSTWSSLGWQAVQAENYLNAKTSSRVFQSVKEAELRTIYETAPVLSQ
ncbi:Fc receptor-like protein 5 [Cyprinodon tularosa]|uniref:Fc receptor-like protein 5 n=1 Tax=Cyprinodon tularosa TaxID=77115 RepID=UPI0018E1FE32|nr:Fc receptor-like protein 5 [Cyprinodon tularosa]